MPVDRKVKIERVLWVATRDVADRVRDVEWDYGETKPAFRTTELIVLVVTVIAVLVTSAVADDVDGRLAWTLVTALSIGYMLSRGIAEAGSGPGRGGRR
jgi:hypothetical protein